MEWQPAETLPRNCTPVLGFWAPANKFQPVDERNYALTYFEAGEWRSIEHWDETYADPTNWMPLPPPPQGARISEIELPELPEPDGSASVVVGHEQVSDMTADVVEEVPAWSEPLVLAYARQAVLADRERLATLVEDKVAPALPPVPEGYALVPIKPTPAMVDVMLDWGTKRSEWEMILRAANPPTDGTSEQVRAAARRGSV